MGFNRAGDRVLSTTWVSQVHLWDAHAGMSLLTLSEGPVAGISAPSDDSVIATRVGDKLRLWRVHSGHEMRVLRHPWAEPNTGISRWKADASGRLLAVTLYSPDGMCFVDSRSGATTAFVPYAASEYYQLTQVGTRDGWVTGTSEGLELWPVEKSQNGESIKVGPPQRFLNHRSSHNVNAHASRDGLVMAIPNLSGSIILHSVYGRCISVAIHLTPTAAIRIDRWDSPYNRRSVLSGKFTKNSRRTN